MCFLSQTFMVLFALALGHNRNIAPVNVEWNMVQGKA